jgi:hypothetical protein
MRLRVLAPLGAAVLAACGAGEHPDEPHFRACRQDTVGKLRNPASAEFRDVVSIAAPGRRRQVAFHVDTREDGRPVRHWVLCTIADGVVAAQVGGEGHVRSQVDHIRASNPDRVFQPSGR